MKPFIFLPAASLALMFSLCACESESSPSTRALRSPTEFNSAENEMLGYDDVTPLAVVELPSDSKDHFHVTTILDPILGRNPPTPTELHPTNPPAVITTGVQLQPTTAPARGGADSTTQP